MTRAPDLIVLGRIASLAGDAGFGWIGGLAVLDGVIVANGDRHEVARLAGAGTRIIELAAGQVALPSVTDAHLHLVAAALAADEVDLEGTPSLAAALASIADAHATRLADGDRDGWIFGRGWAIDGWHDRPTAAALERCAPGRPIALWAHDHHTRWLSEAAMAAVGIEASTADPPGGVVGRDRSGRPNGLLYEHATRLGAEAIPQPTAETTRAAISRYARHLAAAGVTGVHDPGPLIPMPLFEGAVTIVSAMAVAGDLPMRVHAGIRDEQLEAAIAAGLRSGEGVAPRPDASPAERRTADRFRVGWLKLFGDGSVGSRTAAMLEPYDDADQRPGPSGPRGALLESPERLAERTGRAAEAGIATMIHAIGDLAVRTALDAFEATGASRLAELALMPRIEHAQLVHPDDRHRFVQLGVAASMQPVQLRSDESIMRRAWGPRTSLAFPLASLADSGAVIAFGTDAPIEPPEPWPGIATAVTRWAPEWATGTPASSPRETLTLDRALRAATVGPRLTAREPHSGRLVVGAPADLVVVAFDDQAAPAMAAEGLRTERPLLTLLDGEECHRAPGFDR
jgi:predicted amidohydrolase YtcJ